MSAAPPQPHAIVNWLIAPKRPRTSLKATTSRPQATAVCRNARLASNPNAKKAVRTDRPAKGRRTTSICLLWSRYAAAGANRQD